MNIVRTACTPRKRQNENCDHINPSSPELEETPDDCREASCDLGHGTDLLPLSAEDPWYDDEPGAGDEPAESPPGLSNASRRARESVEAWHVLSVGHRPTDFMARDCLFGSLFRDHRVPWFRRLVKKPRPWMESLVGHLTDQADRGQALRYVALHYLHKLHLARLIDFLASPDEGDVEIGPAAGKTLTRLWGCTPYGVEVTRAGHRGSVPPGCNRARLCPWCHARKVARLHEVLSKGPLQNRDDLYLVLGKGMPFTEPVGGVDGTYREEDWLDYTQGGPVRGHWGRYFGRDRQRLKKTRDVLAECLMVQAGEIGLGSGRWTHQLGSAQLENGQRTFLHDLALIAGVDDATMERMPKDEDGKVFWGGRKRTGLPEIDAALEVLWLPLPADNPAALRVALAGSSTRYAVSKLGLPPGWFGAGDGSHKGIPGALSWQPTFLFDDRMWFAYAEAVKGQPLYRPFGSWRESMASAAAVRSSTDRTFARAQATRFGRASQQKGNRRRSREARDRRAELLAVARELWPQVVAETGRGRGRPAHRKRLAELLDGRGVKVSRRDLDWLMQEVTGRRD
jgi:hypothetical protein